MQSTLGCLFFKSFSSKFLYILKIDNITVEAETPLLPTQEKDLKPVFSIKLDVSCFRNCLAKKKKGVDGLLKVEKIP